MPTTDFTSLPELCAERLGGAVTDATDEFFAEKENLIKPAAAVWKEGEYTDRGKWMDGWETRRHRAPDHDWCTIRLGLPGVVTGVVIDTAFFRGNFPEAASLEGLCRGEWVEILPRVELKGDSQNRYPVHHPGVVTQLRLHIYPDGGVARLRVHGHPEADLSAWRRLGEIDLASVAHGAGVTSVTDAFFSPAWHMLLPDRARGMHDGWETKRRRGPGHDTATVRLACEGTLREVEIDTSFFRGNYPTEASVEAYVGNHWEEVVPRSPLGPHASHRFPVTVTTAVLRLHIYPDGGVARLRAWGRPTAAALHVHAVRALWARADLPALLTRCNAAPAWVTGMLAAWPGTPDAMHHASDRIWAALPHEQWQTAIAAHPPIGATGTVSAWSGQEQSGMAGADDIVRARLAKQNAVYRTHFGYTFLINATGKSAATMLAELERRLGNPPETELQEAAAELAKITRIRLDKLLAEVTA